MAWWPASMKRVNVPAAAVAIVLCSTLIHAGWNLLVRSQRTSHTFFRATLVIAAVGVVPALLVEALGTPFAGRIWFLLALSGVFQACYYLGLSRGYLSGDFTVVYPVARVLPIILVALIDVARGQPLGAMGWLGIVLVSFGCTVVPLQSLRAFRLSAYWNPAWAWTMLAGLSGAGYAVVDHLAVAPMEPGPLTAARYEVFECAASAIAYGLLLRALREKDTAVAGWERWKVAALVGVGMFGAYWLVLLAYQLSPRASYVVAMRQFSIVIGVALGASLFHEPARGLRVGAALLIVLGVALVALAG
jgi:drug/metabolite transporter (DMT)-like permease